MPSQRIFVALVKALNAVAIVAFVADLHRGAQRVHGRKFLDRESDRLRCGRKPAIAQRLPRPTLMRDGQNRLNKKGRGNNGGGMPEFEPTAEQREIVSRATHCLGWSAIVRSLEAVAARRCKFAMG